MNNALDSPLEALAINYLSFGFLTTVNNLWTWVAVLAGALSYLITIRKPAKSITNIPIIAKIPDLVETSCLHTTSKQADHQVGSCCDTLEILDRNNDISSHFSSKRGKFTMYYEHEVADLSDDDSAWDTIQIVNTTKSSSQYFSSTKGEFTEYYYEDDMSDIISEDDSCLGTLHILDTKDNSSHFSSTMEWDEKLMLRMRILTVEEMGWYRYQNVTAIDGNMVRLWDGSRGVNY